MYYQPANRRTLYPQKTPSIAPRVLLNQELHLFYRSSPSIEELIPSILHFDSMPSFQAPAGLVYAVYPKSGHLVLLLHR
jgi:hypothetical protein